MPSSGCWKEERGQPDLECMDGREPVDYRTFKEDSKSLGEAGEYGLIKFSFQVVQSDQTRR